MLGFYHKGDRAVIDRYVLNKEADIENYGLWFWDPINFTNRLGWYQVFIVHRGNSMSLYLFEPYGRMEKALHYFGLQSLLQATQWGLGGTGTPQLVLDDFKVYNQALTEEQVKSYMPEKVFQTECTQQVLLQMPTFAGLQKKQELQ